MKFQVGRFTCELRLDDRGEIEATWLPWQPRYLSRDERAQYRAARAVFLKQVPPGSIVDVADRLSCLESDAKTAAIPLALPPLQAIALAHFVKRVDFETVASLAPVTVACDDGKSEADLIWLALIALRGALAKAIPNRPMANEPSSSSGNAHSLTKSLAEMERKAQPRHPLMSALKGLVQVTPGTDLTKPACQDWGQD